MTKDFCTLRSMFGTAICGNHHVARRAEGTMHASRSDVFQVDLVENPLTLLGGSFDLLSLTTIPNNPLYRHHKHITM